MGVTQNGKGGLSENGEGLSEKGPSRGNSFAASGTTSRAPKPLDSKTSASSDNDRASTSSHTSTSPTDPQAKVVTSVVVQSTAALALNWSLAQQNLTTDELAPGVDLNDAGGGIDSGNHDSSKPSLSNSGSNNSASSNSASSNLGLSNLDSSNFGLSNLDLSQIETSSPVVSVAGHSAQLAAIETPTLPQLPLQDVAHSLDGLEDKPGAPGTSHLTGSLVVPSSNSSGAKPNTPSSPLSLSGTDHLFSAPKPLAASGAASPTPTPRAVSRGNSETSSDGNQTTAITKSDEDPLTTSLSAAASALPLTTNIPATVDQGLSDGTPSNTTLDPALDKATTSVAQVSETPDIAGVTRQSVEATGSTKLQSRKDSLLSSISSPGTDQSDDGAPANVIDVSSVSSIAGIAPPAAAGNSNDANASSSHGASDQQTAQSKQDLTGVVQNQGETAAVYPTSVINSAKLIERIGEAELRVGIRAGEFGSVDIRTSMVHNQLTAEISVERGELGRVMAAELPGLQNRLSEQRVPVANITVQNHAGGQSAPSEQQKPRDEQRVYATHSVSRRDERAIPAVIGPEGSTSASRLDIHM